MVEFKKKAKTSVYTVITCTVTQGGTAIARTDTISVSFVWG